MSVQGLKEIEQALKKQVKKTAKELRAGLKLGGLFLMRESQKLVPVYHGFLKASADTRLEGEGLKSSAIVSYGTNYAIYVHEDIDREADEDNEAHKGAAHGAEFNAKYAEQRKNAKTPKQKQYYARRGPNQQAKFLETPAREKAPRIAEIIRSQMGK